MALYLHYNRFHECDAVVNSDHIVGICKTSPSEACGIKVFMKNDSFLIWFPSYEERDKGFEELAKLIKV